MADPGDSAAASLRIRPVRFRFPEEFDPRWNQRHPELACAANAVSLLMPYAEPYFVSSVRAVADDLEGRTRTEALAWARQESQHHAQHRRFNDRVAQRYRGIPRIESWIARTYGWLGRTRSLRFNLAFAAGSETIAFGIARWAERNVGAFFDGADPTAAELFLWHLAEEVEHKSVAFDVHRCVDGSRLRYATAMTLSFAILAWFTTIATLTMLAGDRRIWNPLCWLHLLRWSMSMAFVVLPTMLVSTTRGHHPRDLADPVYLPTWLGSFGAGPPSETSGRAATG